MYLSKYKGPLCSAKMQIFNFAFAAAVSASQGVTQSKKSIAPNYLRVDISPFAALKVPELRMYRSCQCLQHVNITRSASWYKSANGARTL